MALARFVLAALLLTCAHGVRQDSFHTTDVDNRLEDRRNAQSASAGTGVVDASLAGKGAGDQKAQELQKKVDQLTKEKAELQSEKEAAEAQLATSKGELKQTQDLLAAEQKKVKELTTKEEEITKPECTEEKETADQLTKEKAELQSEKEAAEAQLATSKGELKQTQDLLAQEQKKVAELKDAQLQSGPERHECDNKLKHQEAMYQSLDKKEKALRAECDELKAHSPDCSTENQENLLLGIEMEKKEKDCKANLKNAKAKCAQSVKELEVCEKSLAAAEARAELADECKTDKDDLTQQAAKCEEEKEKKTNKLTDCLKRASDCEDKAGEWK